MKTFNLTVKELAVARLLVQSCLTGMGGKRPADLEQDEFTWINPEDLLRAGYTRHEAAGFWSSLTEKGFIEEYDTNEWIVTTAAWRWMDLIWFSTVSVELICAGATTPSAAA